MSFGNQTALNRLSPEFLARSLNLITGNGFFLSIIVICKAPQADFPTILRYT
ncbi:hypothetical protein BN1183_AP_00190 [Pantoea ananatis]|nr:hypothetical protein BN1183_AP_00190 [Pantoea ananatis]